MRQRQHLNSLLLDWLPYAYPVTIIQVNTKRQKDHRGRNYGCCEMSHQGRVQQRIGKKWGILNFYASGYWLDPS